MDDAQPTESHQPGDLIHSRGLLKAPLARLLGLGTIVRKQSETKT